MAHRSALRYNSQLAEDPSKAAPHVNACRDCANMTGVPSGGVQCDCSALQARPDWVLAGTRKHDCVNGRGEGYEVLHPGNVEFILRGY